MKFPPSNIIHKSHQLPQKISVLVWIVYSQSIFILTIQWLQLWPFISYKYLENPIYRMYNPIEITSYNW